MTFAAQQPGRRRLFCEVAVCSQVVWNVKRLEFWENKIMTDGKKMTFQKLSY